MYMISTLRLVRNWWLGEFLDNNSCPSIGKYFCSDCQNRFLDLCHQCAYVRNRCIFYTSPNERVHRCDVGCAGGGGSCGAASTNLTVRKRFIWKLYRIRKPMR